MNIVNTVSTHFPKNKLRGYGTAEQMRTPFHLSFLFVVFVHINLLQHDKKKLFFLNYCPVHVLYYYYCTAVLHYDSIIVV